MSTSVEQLDRLSTQFEVNVQNESRLPSTGTILLLDDDDLIMVGEQIQRMIEAERTQSPNDQSLLALEAAHLFRLGKMYKSAIVPLLLHSPAATGCVSSAEAAEKACSYMYRSFDLCPMAEPAFILGTLFEMADFTESAFYWFEKADKAAKLFSSANVQQEVLRKLQDCQAAEGVRDPDISSSMKFPTDNTPGLKPLNDEEQKKRTERRRQQEEEKQKKVERKRLEEEENRKQETNRQQNEAEKRRRVSAGLCLQCGKPLSFLNTLMDKKVHDTCK